jgi:hypothetical protein
MEILLKCESALKKMERQNDTGSLVPSVPVQPQQQQPQSQPTSIPGKETTSPFQQLLDVVVGTYKLPTSAHTYRRSFLPVVDSLIGSSGFDDDSCEEDTDEDDEDPCVNTLPWTIAKEIKLLDPTVFKVQVVTGIKGTSTAKIRCALIESSLPCVPPLKISVTKAYPNERPSVIEMKEDYGPTPFLRHIAEIQNSRMLYLPLNFTITHLLKCWEMSVRQAVRENLGYEYEVNGVFPQHLQLTRPIVSL